MKKIVLVCGIIAGLISVFWPIFGEQFLPDSISFETRLFFGYAAMVLAFSLIFVGVKSYRDTHNNGVISFGKALKISLLITLVASTVYTITWLINYYFFLPDFGAQYMASMRAELVASGTSNTEIQKQMAEMSASLQQYKNPLYNAMMTFEEIAPVGIIISLIVSLLLKSKTNPAPIDMGAPKIN